MAVPQVMTLDSPIRTPDTPVIPDMPADRAGIYLQVTAHSPSLWRDRPDLSLADQQAVVDAFAATARHPAKLVDDLFSKRDQLQATRQPAALTDELAQAGRDGVQELAAWRRKTVDALRARVTERIAARIAAMQAAALRTRPGENEQMRANRLDKLETLVRAMDPQARENAAKEAIANGDDPDFLAVVMMSPKRFPLVDKAVLDQAWQDAAEANDPELTMWRHLAYAYSTIHGLARDSLRDLLAEHGIPLDEPAQ